MTTSHLTQITTSTINLKEWGHSISTRCDINPMALWDMPCMLYGGICTISNQFGRFLILSWFEKSTGMLVSATISSNSPRKTLNLMESSAFIA